MNARSLSHNYVQKQQSSWNGDPFGLEGLVTGVTPLSHQRSLEDYAQELVSSYAEFIGNQYELHLEKLSAPLQFELARLYIESIDREIEWACYGDDQTLNSDFLCALLAMLKSDNPKTRANFAKVTSENVVIYYAKTLQEILNCACDEYYGNEMNEQGYHAQQDRDSGDVIWGKF